MKFVANEYHALSIYVPDEESTAWYITQTEWVNGGDEIEVDFEYVVEPVFIRDLLNGIFSPVDASAITYQNEVYADHATEFEVVA